ncbi:MAG TPA: TIGR03118 family protein [Tepidisphaeraceae bacterium]|nr:TIGR03118 family protein [Tepidisphaeraceae bacterium]
MRSSSLGASLLTTLVAAIAPSGLAQNIPGYIQTNLVSNIPGLAANTDPNLQNPWGISFSATSFFWVSDNGTGLATLYNGAGAPQGLVVTIPAPGGGTSAPTGQIFNSNNSAFNGDLFIFASEDGTITGWRGALGSNAETLFDNSANGAIYKGIAIASVSSKTYLYATNFSSGQIDVFAQSGAPALTGTFTDPNLPSGHAPFNVQNLNGKLYVTYAEQSGGTDEVDGPGLGFVDIFTLNGDFVQRVASQGALNAPWGLALTPTGWGLPAGDLLVGNFGDGKINVYDPSGTFVGTIADASDNPIANDGLWGLTFGNGGNGGSPTSLYLTAGLNDEADGLFARIDLPEPAAWALFVASPLLLVRRRSVLVCRTA